MQHTLLIKNSLSADREIYNFTFPLTHNLKNHNEVLVNEFYDKEHFFKPNLITSIINKIKFLIKNFLNR